MNINHFDHINDKLSGYNDHFHHLDNNNNGDNNDNDQLTFSGTCLHLALGSAD